jgi:glutathione synthase/RimK-type ligase-like ATP-grasp enzyme
MSAQAHALLSCHCYLGSDSTAPTGFIKSLALSGAISTEYFTGVLFGRKAWIDESNAGLIGCCEQDRPTVYLDDEIVDRLPKRSYGLVLIFGHRADPHVASVVQSLEKAGHSYCIVDSSDTLSGGIRHRISSDVAVQIGNSDARLNELTAVWWRQKPNFVMPTSATGLYDYFFVHREWNQLIDYLGVETAQLFSINDRQKAAVANNKITQLKMAKEWGFEIPATLISNDVESIIDFVSHSDGGQCIYKPFTPYVSPSGVITYTTKVDVSLLVGNRDLIRVAPGIFQLFVAKQFELRVTVVGSEVFAARINSSHSSETEIDWRRDQFSDIYSSYDLDRDELGRLVEFHRKLGLFYAAYDFIVDEAGNLVFLEVNPAGQWMWLELKLGFPVGERIASALANPPRLL